LFSSLMRAFSMWNALRRFAMLPSDGCVAYV
jgi:hypothetical protein